MEKKELNDQITLLGDGYFNCSYTNELITIVGARLESYFQFHCSSTKIIGMYFCASKVLYSASLYNHLHFRINIFIHHFFSNFGQVLIIYHNFPSSNCITISDVNSTNFTVVEVIFNMFHQHSVRKSVRIYTGYHRLFSTNIFLIPKFSNMLKYEIEVLIFDPMKNKKNTLETIQTTEYLYICKK